MERMSLEKLGKKVNELWKENPRSENGKWRLWRAENVDVSDMVGKTISGITMLNEDECQDTILFECDDGSAYLMYHQQDCCESVEIDDINGDFDNLIGRYLALAEVSSSDSSELKDEDEYASYTWTFYRFGTVKGFVDIRWYGESNGYYSEKVDFVKLK